MAKYIVKTGSAGIEKDFTTVAEAIHYRSSGLEIYTEKYKDIPFVVTSVIEEDDKDIGQPLQMGAPVHVVTDDDGVITLEFIKEEPVAAEDRKPTKSKSGGRGSSPSRGFVPRQSLI